jgi:hypothetical protein
VPVDPYVVKQAEKQYITQQPKHENVDSAFQLYSKQDQHFTNSRQHSRKELFKPKKTIGKHIKKDAPSEK